MVYRILAVDNNVENLLTIKYFIDLLQKEIQYFEAKSCAEALEIFEKEVPHIVITELSLPDGKGEDLVLKMREINSRFKLIVQTASVDPNYNIMIQRALRCIDFLSHPLERDTFSDAFNYACEHIPAPKAEKITIVQGNSNTVIRVNELLGGEMVKSEAKLSLYIYKFETQELRVIQLDDMTLMKFLEIARRYTDLMVQCQKSCFVNKERIQKLDARAPAELIMELGGVKFPVGRKFMDAFKVRKEDT